MRRVAKVIVVLFAAILLVAPAVPARADDFAEFEKARNSYNAGRYEESAERFRDMVDPTSEKKIEDSWLLERARMYLAASLIAVGREKEADSQIEAILRQNPSAVPDSVFPTQVLDRFTDVRARIREELEAKARDKARVEQARRKQEEDAQRRERDRVKELERLARQEIHVVHHSRWIAMVPFGVGQFQNGQPELGWTLLGVETALAGTTIASSVIVQSLQSQGTRPNVDVPALEERISTWNQVNNLSFVALAVVAAGGVVHAQMTYVPERRELRDRPLPKSAVATPTATVVDRGVVLGVRGLF